MRARLILKPGQRGTKKLLCRVRGASRVRPVPVRRETAEAPRDGGVGRGRGRLGATRAEAAGETIFGLRAAWQEVGIRGRVKTAGGRWDPASMSQGC